MHDLTRDRDLAIRLMRDHPSDYALMARWLSDPRVLEFYDGRDHPLALKDAAEKYSPRILAVDGVTPCLLLFQDRAVGYMQFYSITEEAKTQYGLDPGETAAGLFAFDQFIGETERWNQGLGTRAVSLLATYLFQNKTARKIVIDPQARNPRAIRCYEKCGFRKVKLLPRNELHEGKMEDCWLMVIEKKSEHRRMIDSPAAIGFGSFPIKSRN